ncbi:MAG: serine/threonine protein kinase, partial [Frankiales bacterium]|nr:serine/threonine protein kinase [Frankiales bacterium]
AVALRRAHSATPVRLTGAPAAAARSDPVRETHRVREAPPSPATSSRTGRRRPPAGALVAGGVGLVLVAAAVVGWRLGDGDAQVAPLPVAVARPSVAASTAPDWKRVLDDLDAARAEAFASGDVASLSRTYAAGSPALAADAAVLRQLVAAGRTARGVRHTVRSVQQVAFDGTTARLRIRDVLAAYQVLDRDGSVLEQRPARGEAPYAVVVVRTAQGFRLREVSAL